ncbi:MAG: hypothetical protein JWO05_1737 [Gemmatimonadetes bacterium]|nr:hypothetical protein [Gemmatimonadota bacterium]
MHVGIVADLREEGWPSMDLVAEALAEALPRLDPPVATTLIRPASPHPLHALRSAPVPALDAAIRGWARYAWYPGWVNRHPGRGVELWHVMDHSYAHVVSSLPRGRCVVTCHDIDAFRSLLVPPREARSALFRHVTGRVLRGLQAAARVTCDSDATRRELVENGLVPAHRTVTVPLAVHQDFLEPPSAVAEQAADRLLEGVQQPFVMHVGSTISRKRIDVLLEVMGALLAWRPSLRLVRVGGALPPAQREMARKAGVAGAIVEMPMLERQVLAALYRRSALVLLPSEREGFGLPVVEALACGTVVLASDLPVLREVGGDVAQYAPVADVGAWTARARALLEESDGAPEVHAGRAEAGRRWSRRYSWDACAARMRDVYLDVLA